MSIVTKSYREKRYGDRYQIEYHPRADGTFKIMCFHHPHNRYSTAVHKCHLYSSGEVCVGSGHEPRSLDRAMAIAIFWMGGYSHYVRTGEFYNGQAKVHV